jgi:hypothetical protein
MHIVLPITRLHVSWAVLLAERAHGGVALACCVVQSRQQRPQEACSDNDACQHSQGVGAATGAATVRVGGPLGVIRKCWLPATPAASALCDSVGCHVRQCAARAQRAL